ncbi:MAG: hypothetical protein II007_06095 [Gammaproteobacteria bacterium]|nr:hypothetical protein [Gammaproteobacteria bacterium]
MTRWLILVGLALAAPLTAEPVVEVESTISGSQEQPRVIYILPWQKPGDGAALEQQLDQLLLQQPLAALERSELQYRLALEAQPAPAR